MVRVMAKQDCGCGILCNCNNCENDNCSCNIKSRSKAELSTGIAGIWAEQQTLGNEFASDNQMAMELPYFDKGYEEPLIKVRVVRNKKNNMDGYTQATIDVPESTPEEIAENRKRMGLRNPEFVYYAKDKKKTPQPLGGAPQLPGKRRYKGRQNKLRGL